MDSQNVVSIARAYPRATVAREVTAHQYAEVVKNRNTYRRLYDQNTAALAQARGQLEGLRQHMQVLESELAAHQAGVPTALLHDAMQLLHEMVADRAQFEADYGKCVRLPSSTIAFTGKAEVLIGRAAPLLTHMTAASE
ncbi:hypothetical protein GCM10007242_16810 [Pigmentiphaga litoralis]|uniref:hypothetical protein n=1 Tax=Pigmentiphaga litoralis TaxID=516702 RepID=UPI001676532E|nr:hypothetical protein [Pigmentiphaga litoralis]GGX11340.1 hypothetical protein GCM10007242_16810 [Pigmentiphaga litoralis]